MYFPYAFPKELYTKPAGNAVLGMVANYQSAPAIYKYLKDNKGVKTVAFIAANESDPLSQRDGGVAAAKALGLNVIADKDSYPNDTRDFTPVLTPIIKQKPDLLVLSGVAPANAPLLIRSARELGYTGLISTETAQDAQVLQEGAGDLPGDGGDEPDPVADPPHEGATDQSGDHQRDREQTGVEGDFRPADPELLLQRGEYRADAVEQESQHAQRRVQQHRQTVADQHRGRRAASRGFVQSLHKDRLDP